MENKNSIASWLAVVAIVIAVIAGLLSFVGVSKAPTLGNATQSFWDAKLGFKVNGTVVIDASRVGTLSTFTQGGGVLATTSAGTVTYTAANFATASLIQHTASGALTATLPASSTLSSFVPNAGDTRTICINAITTKITLAGGTGTDLNTASSTKDIIAGGLGCLTFVRKSNTDIEALFVTGI